MRRLIRKSTGPAVLHGNDAKRWRAEIERHFRIPSQERARRRAPSAVDLLESHEIVQTLIALQRGKCAYCELHFDSSPIVEHYRPLSNAAYAFGRGEDSPDHYSWFALEWSNLMLTCPECSAAKMNVFPVYGDRCLPLSSWAAARHERPQLLNPYTSQIELHITFDRRGMAVALTARGEATVDILRLNRPGILEARRAAIYRAERCMRGAGEGPIGLIDLLDPRAPHCGAVALYIRDVLASGGLIVPRSRDLGQALRKLIRSNRIIELPTHLARTRPTGKVVEASKDTRSPSHEHRPQIIKRVEIKAFKSIGLFTAVAPATSRSNKAPCLMLLGENGSGKSTVLQAIALSLAKPEERDGLGLQRKDFITRLASNWDVMIEATPEVTLDFGDGVTSTFQWDASMQGPEEPAAVAPLVLAYGAHRLAGKSSASLGSVTSLFHPEKQLPSPIAWLESLDDHLFNAVARALRIILALKRDDLIYRTREGKVLTRVQGRVCPIEQLSDGYKSLFAMIVDMMQGLLQVRRDLEYARGVVLIDEIESHLHPRWKMRIVRALREALPGVQFILTTHDPLCLRGMEKDEVAVVYRDRAGELHCQAELPDVSTLRVDQLLTSDLFGLDSTTDPSLDQAVYELAEIIGIPNAAQSHAMRDRRDELLTQLPGIDAIGSDLGRQIVAEAVTRHLREDGVTSIRLRADARRDSIQKIIDVLRHEESRLELPRAGSNPEGTQS
jgi:5-methylcytosine-specific restriction endonuclease McrA/energy-coupling factor transporter ATP-binding protein EcfA2